MACFHKADDKKMSAWLEIFPLREDIIDDIIVTYIFVEILEKLCQERTGEAGHGPGAPYMIWRGHDDSACHCISR